MFIRLNRTPLRVLISALVMLWGLPARASAAISGNFGCLGNFVASYLPPGSKSPQTFTFSQLMQMSVSSTGTLGANIFFGVPGAEICHLPRATGTISVDPTGVGLMTLSFSETGTDEDGDFSCEPLLYYQPSVTVHYHVIATKGGSRFSFFGKDDGITPSSKDSGDNIVPIGECIQQ